MSEKINQKIESFKIRVVALISTVFYYIGIGSYKVLFAILKAFVKGLVFVGEKVNAFILLIFNKIVLTLFNGFKCYFYSLKVAFKQDKGKRFFKNQISILKSIHDKSIDKFHSFIRIMCCLVAVVAIFATYGIWSELRLCYKVVYNGDTIGFIESRDVYENAVDCIGDYIGSNNAESLVDEPKFSFTISNKKNLIEKNTLAVGMIKNTSGFSYAYGLFIDGNRYLVCENYNSIDYNLSIILNKYEYEGDNLTLKFEENVQIIPSYYSNDIIKTANETYSYFEDTELPLTVKATVERTTKKTVKYDTVRIENNNKISGYTYTLCNGKNGVDKVTDKITFENGKAVKKEEISRITLKEPVNKRVVYGTATINYGSVTQKLSGNAVYIWPVSGTRGSDISAYYGDGRGHKGIDIARPRGTNIYSVADGVVTFAGPATGSYSSYGNMVLIKHNDGSTTTAYAHCDQVFLSSGDVVRKGQVIASVGSTGYSTGNHLHFEVRKNGVRVNPASYLGLY